MMSFTLTLSTVLLFASRVYAGSGPQAGSSYTITPAAFPNLCLAPSADSEGASLIVTDCDSSCSTEWVFDGTALRNSAFDKCADVTDGKAKSGNKPQVWNCYDNNPNQAFEYSNGQIKWSGNKYCFDLTGGQGTDGTKVQMWTCQGQNQNQQWDLTEMVDGDGATPTNNSPSSPSQSTIGGDLAAGGGGINVGIGVSVGVGGGHHNTWDSAPSSTASSASPSSTSNPGSGGNGNADMSGYLQVDGTKVVDPQGNEVMLKGTNVGGWLVWEDWMCGISDNSGSADRFPQTTLENRFGTDQTYELLNTWQDNWFVAADFDIIASMGFNVIRLPFSYKNFIYPDGTYITGNDGNVDFSRLDWAISNAKKRGIYVIPTYHIWDGQEDGYSTISENSDEGQRQRDLCGDLWTKIASHFQGESAIAAFDMINEPTGSWGNQLQKDLYTAIRKGDSKRIIIMESISSWPESNWENIMYSMHEYNMMGENDDSGNQAQFWNGVNADVTTYKANGVPAYVGEFMASGDTLSWMLDQMNNMNVWWSGWTYKTVNMDRWGLLNFGSGNWVSVSDDSFDSLKSAWSNMGSTSKSRVYDTYVNACGSSSWKRGVDNSPMSIETRSQELVSHPIPVVQRDEPIVFSPRVAEPTYVPRTKRAQHGGRSRRFARHGKAGRI